MTCFVYVSLLFSTSVLFLRVNGQTGLCMFGDTTAGCVFPCLCTHGCERTSGNCLSDGICQLDDPPTANIRRTGTGCRIGNVALGKPALQSGIYKNLHAGLAVDGIIGSDESHCAHPDAGGTNRAWWYVDLGDPHIVVSVTVFNRKNVHAYQRTGHFLLGVGNVTDGTQTTLCQNYTEIVPVGGHDTIPCESPITGKYVTIRRKSGIDIQLLSLCEVMVHGYKPIDCDSNRCQSCSPLLGCSSCSLGYKYPDCKNECDNEHYGDNCAGRCSGNCAGVPGPRLCSLADGRCFVNGCSNGYWGGLCDKPCSINCKSPNDINRGMCNQTDGVCTLGCKNRFYGDHCNNTCSMKCVGKEDNPTCDRHTGSCALCPFGNFGDSCEYNCSSHCETLPNTQTCEKGDGMCSHGCQLHLYDTWYAGNHCNQSIIYVDFARSNLLYTTNVTSDSVTVEWPHVDDMPLDTMAVYGYRISTVDEKKVAKEYYQTKINKGTLSANYSHTLTGLSANTSYRIIIKVYRQLLDGKREDSKNGSFVSATTLADKGRGHSFIRYTQVGLVGVVAGSVVGFLIIVALVAILVVVLIRKRRSKPSANDDSPIEEIPQYSKIKKMRKPTETTNKKGRDNPTFEVKLEENEPDKVYYDFPATKKLEEGTCVKVEDLELYIGAKQYTEDGIKKEFNNIPGDELESCNVARKKENIIKNRFKNIKAYDCTRVVLESDEEDTSPDYINANFIKGYPNKENHYVATQGPKPETICDLWSMTWQLNSNRIVMVTRIKELNKTKCEQYWPETVGESKTYAGITVTTTACDSYADYNLTIISLQKGGENRTVKHLQFLSWPDKEAPERAFPLLAFRRKLRSFDKNGSGPIVVHCSAGVGRSGTLIALDYLLDQMKTEGKVDVAKLVTQLRRERMNMVQTLTQYVFVYEALLEAYQQGETAIPCDVYYERYQQLVAGNEYSNEVPIEEQFTILSKMKQHKSSDEKVDALSKENRMKNRNPDIIPDNRHRLFLSTKCPGTNDYINAVAVNSFHVEKIFIVTQLPLPNTVVDFWRLAYEQKCHTVVTLQTPDIDEMDCPMYWSLEENEVRKFGNLEVRMDVAEEDEKGFTEERRFTLSYKSTIKDNEVSVRHILFKRWSRNQNLPSKEDTLNLLERLQKWQLQREDGKIIIQCKDGARRSGLICAAHYMLEKLKVEREVDVFLAVRAVALHRQQFVNDLDQYRFLHEIAMEYISRNEAYGNFK